MIFVLLLSGSYVLLRANSRFPNRECSWWLGHLPWMNSYLTTLTTRMMLTWLTILRAVPELREDIHSFLFVFPLLHVLHTNPLMPCHFFFFKYTNCSVRSGILADPWVEECFPLTTLSLLIWFHLRFLFTFSVSSAWTGPGITDLDGTGCSHIACILRVLKIPHFLCFLFSCESFGCCVNDWSFFFPSVSGHRFYFFFFPSLLYFSLLSVNSLVIKRAWEQDNVCYLELLHETIWWTPPW